jgi:hypothetical protein
MTTPTAASRDPFTTPAKALVLANFGCMTDTGRDTTIDNVTTPDTDKRAPVNNSLISVIVGVLIIIIILVLVVLRLA